MKRSYQAKSSINFFSKGTAKRFISLAALCAFIRLFAPYLESAAAAHFSSSGETARLIVSSRLGYSPDAETGSAGLSLLKMTSLIKNLPDSDDSSSVTEPTYDTDEENAPPALQEDGGVSPSDLSAESSGAPAAATAPDTPDAVETTITGESSSYTKASEGIYLKNKTGYEIDVDAILSEEFSFPADAAILIIHTHGSEAYTPDGDDVYTESDPYRTEDRDYNVVRLGDELTEILKARGVNVIHDRELYDYPSYSGSYNRAYDAICSYLEEYPNIAAVIDLHRDALVSDDGTVYKTVADIDEEPCSQVMIISGTNWSGLDHPEWKKNLKFALNLQAEMVEEYPSLARPLSISQYRYNQHATPGSLIVEIGCNGNTLQEGLTAVRYFGDCLANVLTGE